MVFDHSEFNMLGGGEDRSLHFRWGALRKLGLLYFILLAGLGLSILCHSSVSSGTSYGGESAYTARSSPSCSRNPYCRQTVSFIGFILY